jgi:hypothetical protein
MGLFGKKKPKEIESQTPYEKEVANFNEVKKKLGLKKMARLISGTGTKLGEGIYKDGNSILILEIKTDGRGNVLSIEPISMEEVAAKVGKDNLVKTLDQDLPKRVTIDMRGKVTNILRKPDPTKKSKEELDKASPDEGLIITKNSLESILEKSEEENKKEDSNQKREIPKTRVDIKKEEE